MGGGGGDRRKSLRDRVEGRGSGGERDERERGRNKEGQRKVRKGEIDREWKGGREGRRGTVG